jgi:hypothetical protein
MVVLSMIFESVISTAAGSSYPENDDVVLRKTLHLVVPGSGVTTSPIALPPGLFSTKESIVVESPVDDVYVLFMGDHQKPEKIGCQGFGEIGNS